MNVRRDIEIPSSMRHRPIDHRGFPVPWFATEKDENGHWDFVNIRPERLAEAIRFEKCWVSGQKLGRYKTFCVGPMCTINRTAGDAPVTKEIALWSVKVCPFMSRPRARRADHSEDGVFEDRAFTGIAIARNPGVIAVWTTKNSEYQRGRGFYIGDPTEVTWWREGRPATRQEVEDSIDSGIHHLMKIAAEEGRGAMVELNRLVGEAQQYLPDK